MSLLDPDPPAPRPTLRAAALIALMGGAGVLHFVVPGFFDKVVPRAIPDAWDRPITYGSGVVELLCAALLAHPRTRRAGGWATAATLIGVFPANIDTVLAGGLEGVDGFAGSRTAAIARLPLQLPPILWAVRVGRDGG